MDDVSTEAGRFFESYSHQFDEIYRLQQQKNLMGWFNRRFRASMVLRYKKTFETLHPMHEHTVLDIGCGSGRFLVRSLELGAKAVTGIDLSKEMLTISRHWLEETPVDGARVKLICGDFLTQELDNVFDFGIVIGVMDYIKDAEIFLDKLARVVRRKAVLSFPVSESALAFQRKLRYRFRGCPLFLYGRKEVEHLAQVSPFQKYTIERIQRDYFVTVEH